jgi:hypothetical protein
MFIVKITRPTGVSYYAGWDDEVNDWDIDAPHEQARPLVRGAARAMFRHLTDHTKLLSPDQCEIVSLAN